MLTQSDLASGVPIKRRLISINKGSNSKINQQWYSSINKRNYKQIIHSKRLCSFAQLYHRILEMIKRYIAVFLCFLLGFGSATYADQTKLKFRSASERTNTGGSIDINVSAKMLEVNKFSEAYNDYTSQYKRETKIDNLIAKAKSIAKKMDMPYSSAKSKYQTGTKIIISGKIHKYFPEFRFE